MIDVTFKLPSNYFIETYVVGTTWRPNAPGVRITNKDTRNRVASSYNKKQAENFDTAVLLLYLWEEYGIKVDRKDELGYEYYWGVTYDVAPENEEYES